MYQWQSLAVRLLISVVKQVLGWWGEGTWQDCSSRHSLHHRLKNSAHLIQRAGNMVCGEDEQQILIGYRGLHGCDNRSWCAPLCSSPWSIKIFTVGIIFLPQEPPNWEAQGPVQAWVANRLTVLIRVIVCSKTWVLQSRIKNLQRVCVLVWSNKPFLLRTSGSVKKR